MSISVPFSVVQRESNISQRCGSSELLLKRPYSFIFRVRVLRIASGVRWPFFDQRSDTRGDLPWVNVGLKRESREIK